MRDLFVIAKFLFRFQSVIFSVSILTSSPFVAATRVYVVSADLAVFVGILLLCFINLVLICLV